MTAVLDKPAAAAKAPPASRPLAPKGIGKKVLVYVLLIAGAVPTLLPLTQVPFARYFLNTMVLEAGVLIGTMLSCSLAAFSFARLRWRHKNLVFGILMSGVMLPYAVTLIPTFLFWQKLGLVNTYAPLILPHWFGTGVFTFLGVWNDYLGPLIYLNDSDKYTLAMGLASFQGTYTAQWGYLMAAAAVVLLPIVILFAFAQKYFVEGIALTGLKG